MFSLQNRLVSINQRLIPTHENIHSKREMKRNDHVVCVRDLSFPESSLYLLQQKQREVHKPGTNSQDDYMYLSPGSDASDGMTPILFGTLFKPGHLLDAVAA